MASSQDNFGNRGQQQASNGDSSVFRLSREAYIGKVATEAAKHWDEMLAGNAAVSADDETKNGRFTLVCAAEKIDIVETSGRTHSKLVDTSRGSEGHQHFGAVFPNRELIGYASEPEHVAVMLNLVQKGGADKKTLVSMRPADEDKFDEVNTPEALKTATDNTGRNTRRYLG